MRGRRLQIHRLSIVIVSAVISVVLSASMAVADTGGGVDASGWQHPAGERVQWGSVHADGQRFVFIKATEGTGYVNPYFSADWRDSRAAGLLHGAYHYARPSRAHGSAVAQARQFAATVGTLYDPGELPPVLDLETTGGLSPAELIRWTRDWLTATTSLTGRRPIIYTYPYFWLTAMGNTTAFARDYRLWIAHYTSSSRPMLIGGWSQWTFWQYSSSGRVRGIPTAVDMDRFNGSLRELQLLAGIRKA